MVPLRERGKSCSKKVFSIARRFEKFFFVAAIDKSSHVIQSLMALLGQCPNIEIVKQAPNFLLEALRHESDTRESNFAHRAAKDRVLANLHECLQTVACVNQRNVGEVAFGKFLRSKAIDALRFVREAECSEVLFFEDRVMTDLGD
jgi:hypothetical protein